MKHVLRLLLLLLPFHFAMANNEAPCFEVKEVLKVVDGDTLDAFLHLEPFPVYFKVRVRMEGINAWESRTRNLAEKKKGLAAKARLTELVAIPFYVCTKEQGKFGRWIGTLTYENGQSINQLLVDEGHAHTYDGGKRKEFEE